MNYAILLFLSISVFSLSGCGGGSESTPSNPTVVVKPTANFTVTTPAIKGQTVRFSNSSTNTDANTTYNWDFGDGNNSTEQSPTHSYSFTESMKTYTVKLTVRSGTETAIKSNQLEVFSGVISSTIQNDLKTLLDNAFNAKIDKAGASVSIFKAGYPIYNYTNGKASETKAVTTETPFVLYSVTKTIVSAAILKLIEDGKLNLTDKLSTLLNLDYTNLKVNKDVTVAQLLQHTSGIQDFDFSGNITGLISGTTNWSPTEMLKTIQSDFVTPGTYKYTNSNYILLGMIIEKKTGKQLYSAFQDLVANKNISGTLLPRQTRPDDIAQPYDNLGIVDSNQSGTFGNLTTAGTTTSRFFLTGMGYSTWAAAGMVMTAENAARWGMALYGDTDVKILNSNTNLIQSANNATNQDKYGYGITLANMIINSTPRKVYGHGGGGAGYLSRLCYNSDTHTSIAILLNGNNSNSNTGITTFTATDANNLCEGIFANIESVQ